MKKLLFLLLFPMLLAAQPAQDLYLSFPASSPELGSDSVKVWIHVPANYPAANGGVLIGLHGLGDPNNSQDIRTYLSPTSDNYGLLLVCPEPYIGQEVDSLIAKSKAVINETMDSIQAWYQTDLSETYICGYSAGSDVAAHYTLENPVYPIKGFIWYAPGFYGSFLYPNIDTAFAAPIPPICLCHGTIDLVSQSGAASIENLFAASSIPFLKVSPLDIGHTMNYPAFTNDIAKCMNFFIDGTVSIQENYLEQVKIYPNPIRDQILIEGNGQEKLEVELSNLSGQRILSYDFETAELKIIPMQNINSGIYLLKITNENQESKILKVIKM